MTSDSLKRARARIAAIESAARAAASNKLVGASNAESAMVPELLKLIIEQQAETNDLLRDLYVKV